MTNITNRRLSTKKSADYYPTPEWATLALFEYEKFEGEIWEPACGGGHMAKVMERIGHRVYASDVADRGCGETGVDFLTEARKTDNVVTNPPYSLAEEFVRRALSVARRKTAFLLRLSFLEGAKRHGRLFKDSPPSRVWVFSERVTFREGTTEGKQNGTTAYAWFVWEAEGDGRTEIRWIEPGAKH